jgi:hypothetical protein
VHREETDRGAKIGSGGTRPMHKEEMDMGAKVASRGTQTVHGEEMDNAMTIESGGVRPMCEEEIEQEASVKLGKPNQCKKEIDKGVEVWGLRAKRKQMGRKLGKVMGNAIVRNLTRVWKGDGRGRGVVGF